MKIPEMEENVEKKFSVFKIISFESGAANSQHPEHDICHPQSNY